MTDDPDVLRHMAAARSTYGRDSWYSAAKWYPDRDTMASMLDTAEHDRFKAKTAGGYSGRENTDLEAALSRRWPAWSTSSARKHLASGDDPHAVDFGPLSRFFTVDVITRLGLRQALRLPR